jgi:hypothetical protein
MSRETTIKKLFTLSGNVCAFPNCGTTMIDENLIIIGEICHIEGERMTSARYNLNMTEEQRMGFDNLILLCPTHHTTVDKDPANYTKDSLKKMKTSHENKNKTSTYNAPFDILKILNISVNRDEYSLERIHNLLRIYHKLEGDETKKLWNDYFKYVLKGRSLAKELP